MKNIIITIIICMFSCQENETITTKVDSTQVGITTEQWETAQKYQHYNTVRFPEK